MGPLWINKADSRCAVVRFCYHSYDYRPNWTPLSPITTTNLQDGLHFYMFPFSLHASLKKPTNTEKNITVHIARAKLKIMRTSDRRLGKFELPQGSISTALSCLVEQQLVVEPKLPLPFTIPILNLGLEVGHFNSGNQK